MWRQEDEGFGSERTKCSNWCSRCSVSSLSISDRPPGCVPIDDVSCSCAGQWSLSGEYEYCALGLSSGACEGGPSIAAAVSMEGNAWWPPARGVTALMGFVRGEAPPARGDTVITSMARSVTAFESSLALGEINFGSLSLGVTAFNPALARGGIDLPAFFPCAWLAS